MVALLWGAWFCPEAAAYVPSASSLLQQMRQVLGRADAVMVQQQVSTFDGGGQAEGIGLSETLRFEFPGRFRSDIHGQSIQRIHVVSKARSLTALNGRVVSESEGRYDVYKDLFLYAWSKSLEERLTYLGVDIGVSSLGRLDGHPVYVVGARYPDMAGSQLWLDKETLRPVRWIILPEAGTEAAGLLDVRYTRWHQADGLWYPEEIYFYLDGTRVRRILAESVEAVDGFKSELFDIDRLKSAFEAATAVAPRHPTVVEEVRDAIESFGRLYK